MATATQPQAVKPTPLVSGKSVSLLRRSLEKDQESSSSSSEDESGSNAEGEVIPSYLNVFDEMAAMEDNIATLKAKLKEWNYSNESDTGGSGTEAESEACPRTPGGAPTDAEEE